MTVPDQAPSLLVVDDDEIFRHRLARAFQDRGYRVYAAGNAEEAEKLSTADSPDYAVIDLRMPGRSGLEVVASLHRANPSTRMVVLTGYGSIATALEAVRLGANHYLTKPAHADEIIAAFSRNDGPTEPSQDIEVDAPSLDRVEWEHINRVLADCGGNVSKAARVLGIHRRSLQRKLSRFPSSR